MARSWWSRLFGKKNTTSRKAKRKSLECTRLEDRLTPAFNMTISSAATSGVSTVTAAGTTTFTATATGAT